MPAVVNSSVGSSCGMRLELLSTVWPLLLKNSRNALRISGVVFMTFLSMARHCNIQPLAMGHENRFGTLFGFFVGRRLGERRRRRLKGRKSAGDHVEPAQHGFALGVREPRVDREGKRALL